MDDNKIILTQDGYTELLREIENRKTIVRNEIADEIEKAREQGDLSENASYKVAMEKKEFNENKITDLEEMLKTSVIEDGKDCKTGAVCMGSNVKVKYEANGIEKEFSIVGENESDPITGKISVRSELGKNLLGHKNKDEVTFTSPAGQIIKLKIIEVK
jgi:transcription elongation factor GreA